MVSISKSPTLRPGQYRPVQVKLNLIRVHGSSEYMGRQSTWVVRVHGSSEYMGRQSTWVVRVHGSSEYMVSISKCPTLRPGQYRQVQVKSNLIRVHGSSEYMGHQSTWVIRVCT